MSTRWRELAAYTREPGGLGGPWLGYGLSMLAVVVLGTLVVPFRDDIGGASVSLLYVLLLLGIGLLFGTGPAVASAVLAFVITNLFFYPPYNTLEVDGTVHVVTVTIFLGIATSAGVLAARLRRQADDALREARRASMLYDLNRALTSDVTLDQVLASIVRGVVAIYGARGSRLLVRSEGRARALSTVASWPATMQPDDNRQARHMALHALESGTVVGLGTAGRRVVLPRGSEERTLPATLRRGDDLLYVPVGTSAERFGVLEVSGRPGGGRFGDEDERMLKSFADQAALAVQRARLIDQVTRTRVLEQSNELKSALLAAVSHDLRTPLAAIKMSASALQDPAIEWDDASRGELLSAIIESTDWLTLVVGNLLDLSRIEGGALRPDRDWHDLADLVQHVAMQMEHQLARHRLSLDIDPELPLVYLDYVQISQVLTNLIANAVKYSEPGSEIDVAARAVGEDQVELRVTDHGDGIPASSLPYVFETFYRARTGHGASGSGVGLAICKGLVEAHGGTISAESAVGKGTTMRVRLPVDPGTSVEMER